MTAHYLDDLLPPEKADAPTCVTCKHCLKAPLFSFAPLTLFVDFPLCFNPTRRKFDLIDGWSIVSSTCRSARAQDGACGPEGRMYAPSLRTRIVKALFGRFA